MIILHMKRQTCRKKVTKEDKMKDSKIFHYNFFLSESFPYDKMFERCKQYDRTRAARPSAVWLDVYKLNMEVLT